MSFLPPGWGRIAFKVLLFTALAVAGYLIFRQFLRVAATVVVLAVMLTYLLQPIVERMVRVSRFKNVRAARVGAALVIYVVLAYALVTLGSSIGRSLKWDFRELQMTWVSARHHIPTQLERFNTWYEGTVPLDYRQQINTSVQQELKRMPDKYMPRAVVWAMGFAQGARRFLGLLVELLFVPLIAFYFLTDSAVVREQMLSFVPRRYRESVTRYAGGMNQILRHYCKGQVILCAIAWFVVTAALMVMNVPGAMLLGVIAGLARAIPLVGPIVGGIPVLAAIVFDPHWSGAFWWVLIGFTLLHLVESKLVMPRILGDQIHVHPVLIIISLLIGYEMMGFLGMFLAPPTVAIIRFILAVRRGEGPFAVDDQLTLPGLAQAVPEEES